MDKRKEGLMPEPVHRELPIEIAGRFLCRSPVDLQAMARALGVDVQTIRFDEADIAGNIERVGDGYRISINDADSSRRQRFTLAHEIAHYLLHRDLIGDGVTDRGLYRSRLRGAIESQANRYAASLLMPAALVRQAWAGGERDAAAIASRFNVSDATAAIRLDELGLTRRPIAS